jgi:flotillin
MAAAVGFGAVWLVSRYRVAGPGQYIVRTGPGIPTIAINKKAMQWPLQKAAVLEMAPSNYNFNLQAMSEEKMEFVLPGVFTIGPEDKPEALQK